MQSTLQELVEYEHLLQSAGLTEEVIDIIKKFIDEKKAIDALEKKLDQWMEQAVEDTKVQHNIKDVLKYAVQAPIDIFSKTDIFPSLPSEPDLRLLFLSTVVYDKQLTITKQTGDMTYSYHGQTIFKMIGNEIIDIELYPTKISLYLLLLDNNKSYQYPIMDLVNMTLTWSDKVSISSEWTSMFHGVIYSFSDENHVSAMINADAIKQHMQQTLIQQLDRDRQEMQRDLNSIDVTTLWATSANSAETNAVLAYEVNIPETPAGDEIPLGIITDATSKLYIQSRLFAWHWDYKTQVDSMTGRYQTAMRQGWLIGSPRPAIDSNSSDSDVSLRTDYEPYYIDVSSNGTVGSSKIVYEPQPVVKVITVKLTETDEIQLTMSTRAYFMITKRDALQWYETMVDHNYGDAPHEFNILPPTTVLMHRYTARDSETDTTKCRKSAYLFGKPMLRTVQTGYNWQVGASDDVKLGRAPRMYNGFDIYHEIIIESDKIALPTVASISMLVNDREVTLTLGNYITSQGTKMCFYYFGKADEKYSDVNYHDFKTTLYFQSNATDYTKEVLKGLTLEWVKTDTEPTISTISDPSGLLTFPTNMVPIWNPPDYWTDDDIPSTAKYTITFDDRGQTGITRDHDMFLQASFGDVEYTQGDDKKWNLDPKYSTRIYCENAPSVPSYRNFDVFHSNDAEADSQDYYSNPEQGYSLSEGHGGSLFTRIWDKEYTYIKYHPEDFRNGATKYPKVSLTPGEVFPFISSLKLPLSLPTQAVRLILLPQGVFNSGEMFNYMDTTLKWIYAIWYNIDSIKSQLQTVQDALNYFADIINNIVDTINKMASSSFNPWTLLMDVAQLVGAVFPLAGLLFSAMYLAHTAYTAFSQGDVLDGVTALVSVLVTVGVGFSTLWERFKVTLPNNKKLSDINDELPPYSDTDSLPDSLKGPMSHYSFPTGASSIAPSETYAASENYRPTSSVSEPGAVTDNVHFSNKTNVVTTSDVIETKIVPKSEGSDERKFGANCYYDRVICCGMTEAEILEMEYWLWMTEDAKLTIEVSDIVQGVFDTAKMESVLQVHHAASNVKVPSVPGFSRYVSRSVKYKTDAAFFNLLVNSGAIKKSSANQQLATKIAATIK